MKVLYRFPQWIDVGVKRVEPWVILTEGTQEHVVMCKSLQEGLVTCVSRVGDRIDPVYSQHKACWKWYGRVGSQITTVCYTELQLKFQQNKISYTHIHTTPTPHTHTHTCPPFIYCLAECSRGTVIVNGFSNHLKIPFLLRLLCKHLVVSRHFLPWISLIYI